MYILISAEFKGKRDDIDDRNTYTFVNQFKEQEVYRICSVYSMTHKIYAPNCKTRYYLNITK